SGSSDEAESRCAACLGRTARGADPCGTGGTRRCPAANLAPGPPAPQPAMRTRGGPWRPGRTLEQDLQTELHLTRVARSGGLTERAAGGAARDRGLRRVERHRRETHVVVQPLTQEIQVVEDVEDLEAQLQLCSLRRVHGLVEGQVGLEHARPAAVAARLV